MLASLSIKSPQQLDTIVPSLYVEKRCSLLYNAADGRNYYLELADSL